MQLNKMICKLSQHFHSL